MSTEIVIILSLLTIAINTLISVSIKGLFVDVLEYWKKWLAVTILIPPIAIIVGILFLAIVLLLAISRLISFQFKEYFKEEK